MLIKALALPIVLAAFFISSTAIPQFLAASLKLKLKALCLHASKLEVCILMKAVSIFLRSINYLAIALNKMTSVPGKICRC